MGICKCFIQLAGYKIDELGEGMICCYNLLQGDFLGKAQYFRVFPMLQRCSHHAQHGSLLHSHIAGVDGRL